MKFGAICIPYCQKCLWKPWPRGHTFHCKTVLGGSSKPLLEGNQVDNSEDWHGCFWLCIKENWDFNRDAQTQLLSHPAQYLELSGSVIQAGLANQRGCVKKNPILSSSNKSPKSEALLPALLLICVSEHAIIFVLWENQDTNLPWYWVGRVKQRLPCGTLCPKGTCALAFWGKEGTVSSVWGFGNLFF